VPPFPSPVADPFNCQHQYINTDRVTDISGKDFVLTCCKRCGMEFVFRLNEKGEAVLAYYVPAPGWIH
jgi:hypothetical protein